MNSKTEFQARVVAAVWKVVRPVVQYDPLVIAHSESMQDSLKLIALELDTLTLNVDDEPVVVEPPSTEVVEGPTFNHDIMSDYDEPPPSMLGASAGGGRQALIDQGSVQGFKDAGHTGELGDEQPTLVGGTHTNDKVKQAVSAPQAGHHRAFEACKLDDTCSLMNNHPGPCKALYNRG